jgi:hypothetical protein
MHKLCINMFNIACMNLKECFINLIHNRGEYEFVDHDYIISFKFLTFADDKKARKGDLENIGKDLRTSINKYKLEYHGEG